MSEALWVDFNLNAPCTPAAVGAILSALRAAIRENGVDDASGEKRPVPYARIELSNRSLDDILQEMDDANSRFGPYCSRVILREFSPLSSEPLEVNLRRHSPWNTLDVTLSLLERARFEVEGSREKEQMEFDWMKELERRGRVSLESGWSFI